MTTEILPVPHGGELILATAERRLTAREFQALTEIPTVAEWFLNIANLNTRRAYRKDLETFMAFCGITHADEFRLVTQAHLSTWRESLKPHFASASVRRKLAALSSLFDHLCDRHALTHNPAQGVKRPAIENPNEGKAPQISERQARALLDAPPSDTPKGVRDRAILSVFLFHGLRREELCTLRICDRLLDRGITYLRVHGKGGKQRKLLLHPETSQRIDDYLQIAFHRDQPEARLFRSLRGTATLTPDGVYRSVVKHYAAAAGIDIERFGPHSLRATAATSALQHRADIKEVQKWLGHANISTTQLYDRRESDPQDSPTLKVFY